MPLVSGATAAGLNIVRLLGCGQIGELYLAEHPRLPRHYALKILSPDVSADPEYRYRFKQESDRAAALWHPNIIGLNDRGEFEDRLWLSMDYVDSADAGQLLSDTYSGGVPPDMVLEIVSVIADALDYVHENGLVHRYVNPSNILLTNSASDRRRIVLAGLGIARRTDEINSLTRANLGIGTVSYAAPEQLMDDSIDGRTDQYALAATAFHLLTGSPPFAHMNPAVVKSKHLNEPAPQPGDVRPELTYFDAPFARALKKNPTERFRRCRDFAKALETKEKLGSYIPNAGPAVFLDAPENRHAAPENRHVAPENRHVAPTEPPAPPPPGAAAPAPPAAEVDDAVAPPDVLPETEVDDAITFAEPDVRSAPTEDTAMALRRRLLLHYSGLVLTIMAVALGGFLGVMALRSASEPEDTSPNIETSSSVTSAPPARPAPVTAIPPPTIAPPAPVATTPPPAAPATPSSVVTTTPAASSASPPETTVQPTTTRSRSTPPTTTPLTTTSPTGLDTRPAVGMPCGPEQSGTTATSTLGGPVTCVGTPGGFAWEPPGG
jgi:serine/threonine protein kinase, bacterial